MTIDTRDDFLRVFRDFSRAPKTLMIFREHRPGVETLPPPIAWLDPELVQSAARGYSSPVNRSSSSSSNNNNNNNNNNNINNNNKGNNGNR